MLLVKLMVILLGVGHLRGHLHGEVGLVFAGEHPVGHLVENLRQLARVVLADGKDDGLANLAADRVAQGILEKGLAEQLDWWPSAEEALLELALPVASLWSSPVVILEFDDEALVGKELGGDRRCGRPRRWG